MNPRLLKPALAIAIGIWTLMIFAASPSFDFVWDDREIIVNNALLQQFDLRWMFIEHFAGHYHPLTWLSLAIDYRLWGLNPFGFHLVNNLLHAANAVLLYFCLIGFLQLDSGLGDNPRLLWVTAIIALLFSVHPLRVESVAWITERRDLLSAFFLLLALRVYLRAALEESAIGFNRNVFLFFLLSLLSKAWAIGFPVLLLLLDFHLEREKRIRLPWLLDKLKTRWSYFAIALVFAALALVAQQSAGAALSLEVHSIGDRLLQASYGFVQYPWKWIVPLDLSPLYLLGDTQFQQGRFYLHAIAALTGFAIAFAAWRRQRRGFMLVLLAYVVIIFPVLGFVQSGPQLMADRYTYLALLPFHFALASWLVQIWMTGVIRIPFRLGVLAGLGLVIVLGSLSLRQTWHWQDEESLWTRVIDVEPDNYWAWVDRGLYRLKANRPDDALPDFDRALAIDPTNAAALNGRAVIFILEGEFDKATADLDKAIHLVPRYVDAISNRGVAHFNNQAFEAARRDFQRALELDASDATLWFKMALCEIELGNDDSARAAFEQAKQRGYNTDQIRYYQKRIE